MELLKITLAMALYSFLLLTVIVDGGENPALGTSGDLPTTPSSDYDHESMTPSLRRLARAIAAEGSGYGYDDHTGERRRRGGPNPGRPLSCDESSKICHKNYGLHWHCCGTRCVDLKSDESNCGHCRNRCPYRFKCCKGRCVDVMYDQHHCGSCNKKCNIKGKCVYGMCDY